MQMDLFQKEGTVCTGLRMWGAEVSSSTKGKAHRGRVGSQGLSLICFRLHKAARHPRGQDESGVRQTALEF